MKNNAKYFIYLLIFIFLTACGKAPVDPTLSVIQTKVVLTVIAQIQTDTVPTATPSSTVTPQPTLTPSATFAFPTSVPTKLPEDVKASLTVETLEPFDGHTLQRISGWRQGFDGFTWMDAEHLFLYPITSERHGDYVGKNEWFSYPTVINLDSGKVWLPPTEYKPFYRRSSYYYLPKWSSQLAGLIAQETETSVQLYSPDGDLRRTYQGLLAGVSPSGSKILLGNENPVSDLSAGSADVRWIDLLKSKEVVFHWPFPPRSITSGYMGYPPPIWSADEMRVYASYHLYGNAKTGESFLSTENMFDEAVSDYGESIDHTGGVWVLNNSYLLAQWYVVYEGMPRFIVFFDPAKKAYRSLTELAGLPKFKEATVDTELVYPCETAWPDTTLGGRYIWENCQDGGRLIDMQNFKAQIYPSYPEATLQWSADGNFAFLSHSSGDPTLQLLLAASNQLKPIPNGVLCSTWHPTQNKFVALSADKKILFIFDAQNLTAQQTVFLPNAFHCPRWSESGDKLMMTAEDDSLWQINYPVLNDLEQLTKPMKGLKNFSISPDGLLIAFSAGIDAYDQDIYIVDTRSKP